MLRVSETPDELPITIETTAVFVGCAACAHETSPTTGIGYLVGADPPSSPTR